MVFPSEAVQAAFPLDQFPCKRCARGELPHLVDNSSEFYWEHQTEENSNRDACTRFGSGNLLGDMPRRGTAKPTYYKGYRWHHGR